MILTILVAALAAIAIGMKTMPKRTRTVIEVESTIRLGDACKTVVSEIVETVPTWTDAMLIRRRYERMYGVKLCPENPNFKNQWFLLGDDGTTVKMNLKTREVIS